MKFIELIVALGDARGRSKRTKRKDDLSRDAVSSFEELFGESPIASILVSLLDILFLKKDVNQRSGITELPFFFVSTLGCVCLTFDPRAGRVYYNRFSRFFQSSFLINGFQGLFVSIPMNMIPHPKPLIYPTP